MRRVIVTLILIISFVSHAQPCEEWDNTLGSPEYVGGVNGRDILAVDGLVLVVGATLQVCDLANSDHPIVGECALPPSNTQRLRAMGSNVYLASGESGVLKIDLSDPTAPAWTTVFAPAPSVHDLVILDQCAVVVAGDGQVFVLDSLESGGQVIAQVVVSGGLSRVAAAGTSVVVGGQCFAVIDLSDPAAPVVSEREICEIPWAFENSVTAIVVDGTVVHAVCQFHDVDHSRIETYRMAYALDAPAGSPPLECEPFDSGVGELISVGDLLVGAHSSNLFAYSLPGLVREAVAAHPEYLTDTAITVSADEIIVLERDYGDDGLWRYPRGPLATVSAVATMPAGYDPSGCGRFGLGISGTVDFWGDGLRIADVYDQSDPFDPMPVYHIERPTTSELGCNFGLSSGPDEWAALRISTVDNNPDEPDLSRSEILTIDAQGNSHLCASAYFCATSFAGDLLWIYTFEPPSSFNVEAFDLAGDSPEALGPQTVGIWGKPFALDDLLLIVGVDRIDVYDARDPAAIVFENTVEPPEINSVWDLQAGPDRLWYLTTESGVQALVIDQDADTPVELGGHLSLGRVQRKIAVNGSLVATADATGWRLISFAVPDTPVILSEFLPYDVDGFAWAGDHLYVGVPGGVYLYDVTSPTAPIAIGQATGIWGQVSPCLRSSHLMDASRVYPLDCGGVLTVDDDGPGVPAARILDPVTPNPFNPSTSIRFDLADAESIELWVHDLRGRRLACLASGMHARGHYTVIWHGTDDRGRALASGTYIIRLTTESSVRTTKAVLIR